MRLRYNEDLIVANVLFGCNFPVLVSLTQGVMDYRMLFVMEVMVVALCFIPHLIFDASAWHLEWRDVRNIIVVTLFVVYGWLYMLLWGASSTNAFDASTLATLGPVITLVASRIATHRRMRLPRIVGVVVALFGAGLLLFDQGERMWDVGSEVFGNALVLVAVVAIAINTVIIKPQLERLGTRTVLAWCSVFALPITLPLFWHYFRVEELAMLSPIDGGELAYALLLGTALPLLLLYRGAEKLSAVHTALYRYIQPTIAWSVAIVRHRVLPDKECIIAMALIALGVLFVVAEYNINTKRG